MKSASNAIFEVQSVEAIIVLVVLGLLAGGLHVSVSEPIVGPLIIGGDLDHAGKATLIITREHEAGALADDLGKAA